MNPLYPYRSLGLGSCVTRHASEGRDGVDAAPLVLGRIHRPPERVPTCGMVHAPRGGLKKNETWAEALGVELGSRRATVHRCT